MTNERRRQSRLLANALRFTGMGWSIAVPIVIGVALGNWLDGRAGTHPLFLLLGILLGLAVGLTGAIRLLLDVLREEDNAGS